MKIGWNWLQDYLDLQGMDSDRLSVALGMLGFPVESVDETGDGRVLELEVTTNRPDCLNHLGIAREVSARFGLELRVPDLSEPPGRVVANPGARVSIEAPDLCPRYAARVMSGVRIGPSPDWLKRRIESVGQRPINNVVDVTNFVLYELGQPLHGFDLDRLSERRIIVRRGAEGERLATLDGEDRRLDPSMLVIADATRAVALAGIMGGMETEISGATTDLLLESAYFEPLSVRRTAKRLGMRTDASYRFERGADPDMATKALNRACRMIREIAGGSCQGPVIDEFPRPIPAREIRLRSGRLTQVLGVSVDPDFVEEVLGRLGFEPEPQDESSWRIRVPSFRADVALEDDLVEEVAREYGYERLPTTYPAAAAVGKFSGSEGHKRRVSSSLESCGFYEAVNYAFTNPGREEIFLGRRTPLVPIANPLSEEHTHLRSTLLPGLAESIRHNLNFGNRSVRLFETGKVFFRRGDDLEQAQEEPYLGLAATGSVHGPFWSGASEPFGFHHLKGVLQMLFRKFGFEVEYRAAAGLPFLHPGISAEILREGRRLGVLGRLHPRLHAHYKFSQDVLVAELRLDELYGRNLEDPAYQVLTRFPSVEHDFSFLVDKSVSFATLINAIRGLSIPELRDIRLIDLYRGSSVPKDKVGLTLRLTFADAERTLTLPEVKHLSERVFSFMRRELGVEGR
ncbi:MAG: phenylalanine--tRNA ligase subunit beta [Acidobacteriota bacterium]|nr:phenylalanine--tRNA ligase subunit beta [Acidobacteriota bacterium]